MSGRREGLDDFDEMLEDSGEDLPDNIIIMKIADVWWAEDIAQIEDPEIRAKEIEAAEKILEKEQTLERKLESGEITKNEYLNEYDFEIRPQKRRAATRCGLESVGLSYDHLGDLAEDYDILISGDLELAENKERLKDVIDDLGPEAAQQLADRMLEEGRIPRETHESISRQVRLHQKR